MARKVNTTEAPLIFIVDDDVSVRRSTGRFVRSLGMRAETFASPQDLLNSGRVAEATCLILDVRMPNIDGPDLQRRLSVFQWSLSAHGPPKKRKTGLCIPGQWPFCENPSGKSAPLRVIHMVLESVK
jgi:hypothetical protein